MGRGEELRAMHGNELKWHMMEQVLMACDGTLGISTEVRQENI